MARSVVEQASSRGTWKHRAGWLLGGSAVLLGLLVIRTCIGVPTASAKTPPTKQKNTAQSQAGNSVEVQKPKLVAVVNGEEISRDELARECLRHYGKEVLESLVNKNLIGECCKLKGVSVSDKEVDAEIERMSQKFSLSKEQWLKMLQKERGIKPAQYEKDIIWPTIALRKLAAARLTVTQPELDKAYESQFGPAVKARMIVVGNQAKAQKIRAQAAARPDEFGTLAKNQSEDVNTASANGLIQPIRKHLGQKEIEQVAFNMQKGEISPVVRVGEQFVILKCEGQLPPIHADRAQVDGTLTEALKERKLRGAAADLFKELQKDAVVQNIFNDPEKSKQMPGVAATINDRRITVRELSEECVERHGIDVLEGTVNRKLLEQGLKKRKMTVTQQDLDTEVARAAVSMGKVKEDGKPDVQGWLEAITKQQGITIEVYLRDAVWPSVALKKLVGENIKISQEDITRGIEANWGKRIRCRAIVLANQRKAQDVWEQAREKPTVEQFGDLAEKFSIEANSRSLRGEVPPIQKNGGQPILEKEAFRLQPGELSGIIQVGENFVILFCEGYTEAQKVNPKEVEKYVYEDIHEKKQRIAMAKEFDRLKDAAQIDNYLAGTLKAPKTQQNATEPALKSASKDHRMPR